MVNQREELKKKRYITFMLLPHSSSKSVVRINLPYWLAVILGTLAAALVIAIIAAFIYSSKITTRLIHYSGLQAENKRQEQQLELFIEKTKELEHGVRELEERDQELREMLGLQKKSSGQKSDKRSSVETPEAALERIALLSKDVQQKSSMYNELKQIASNVTYKFAALPSIWPVNGAIISPFGWRRHPFTGRQEFHNGVDIPLWEGYPIKAAADGVIVYADWSNGYGQTIVIDHKNGYSTLYAHCSQLLGERWERVSKGQVIAKVGSTGLSTGPHLHYQVEKNNKTINPIAFLDLNIRSASRF